MLAAAGLGRHVIQTNKTRLNLFAGLAVNQEDFEGFPVESSTEAVGGLQFGFFKLNEPGLATISRDSGAAAEALDYARKLAQLVPHDPGVGQLVQALEREVG